MAMTRRTTRSILLTGLLSVVAACVINTRPHLPGDDTDAGRAAADFDASAAADAGAFTGTPTGDASATDVSPPAVGDAAGGTEYNLDCFPADGRFTDGGAWTDGGDARVLPDGGDAGFIDRDGRSCDPTKPRGDAGRDAAGGDASDARTSR